MIALMVKHKSEKRFKGFNFKTGTMELNRIYYSIFNDNESNRKFLNEEMEYMKKMNKDYDFKIMKL